MGIKETPTNYRTYFNLLKTRNKERLEIAKETCENLLQEIKVLKEEILSNLDLYKDTFNINLLDIEEFVENKYIDGSFCKKAKGLFINKKDNYNLVSDLFNLYKLSNLQLNIHKLNKDIILFEKIDKMPIKEYNKYLQIYFNKVHEKLIMEGNGYVFGENIGWICINRCKILKGKKMLDYAATKKKKRELLDNGVRLFNKEEKQWCEENGISYNGADYRVYKTEECCYEVPLLRTRIPNGNKITLTITDYRHQSIRGKTNEQLLEECNNDVKKICNLQVDLKTKLTLSLKANSILYSKFIRNENQTPITHVQTNRKD